MPAAAAWASVQLVVVAAHGYRYQFGFDLVALPVVADYGYRHQVGFVPDARQVVADYGYLYFFIHPVLTFGFM